MDQESNDVAQADVDDRPAEEIAQEIVGAELDSEALVDLDDLGAIAGAAESLAPEHTMGLRREFGERRRQFADSPVKSSCFT
jgi:hypothetical protein